jgi:uncharacterized membrane protein
MTRLFLAAAVLLALGQQASAECYADYKAKQDDPLRFHYGVAQVSDAACSGGPEVAAGELAPRLASAGWTLLLVVSVFGPEGLNERRSSATESFLRY